MYYFQLLSQSYIPKINLIFGDVFYTFNILLDLVCQQIDIFLHLF